MQPPGKLYLPVTDKRLVEEILQSHIPEYEVRAFGSRVHGRHLREFSDLDLAVMTDAPLDIARYSALKQAFSDSDLPFRVDIVDWAATDKPFRNIILAEYSVLQHAGA